MLRDVAAAMNWRESLHNGNMISRLRGELIEISEGRVVVECGGVGYEAMIGVSSLHRMPRIGDEVILHTRHIVREDDHFLVGFLELIERRVFDLLTDVKGCGPKVSLAIIGDLGAENALDAIALEDSKRLCKASGVGPRLAERIIVELKEKARNESLSMKLSPATQGRAVVAVVDDELVEALLALGYKRFEAEAAANAVGVSSGTVEERLREALRTLTR